MSPHRGNLSIHLVTESVGCWDSCSDDSSPQLSPASSSPVDSDPSDTANDEIFRRPEKEEADSIRGGDPYWVARPRNAFIIFRCEYAQRHARMKGTKRGAKSTSDKSLSKRAAEAWHQLPGQEKNHFKALADYERSEHARLHPEYRFRPVKRVMPGARPRRDSLPSSLRRHPGDSARNGPEGGSTKNGSQSVPRGNVTAQMRSQKSYSLYYEAAYDSSHLLASHQGPTEIVPLPLATSSLYSPSDSAMTSSLSHSPISPAYPCSEGIFPPPLQYDSNPGSCQLQHPTPLSASSSVSWLADCGDNVIYGWMPHLAGDDCGLSTRETQRQTRDEDPSESVQSRNEIQHAHANSKLLLASSCSSGYTDQDAAHPEYFYSDFLGSCYSIVTDHPSPHFALTFNEVT